MTIDLHTVTYRGAAYLVDSEGIADNGHRVHQPAPPSIHLQAARAIAEMPDHDINDLPVDQQIMLGQLHALIAIAEAQPRKSLTNPHRKAA